MLRRMTCVRSSSAIIRFCNRKSFRNAYGKVKGKGKNKGDCSEKTQRARNNNKQDANGNYYQRKALVQANKSPAEHVTNNHSTVMKRSLSGVQAARVRRT